MPHIAAFRGLRYDLGHVGSLEGVVAPPYEAIDAELRNELYKQHPANAVRLISNRMEPGDADNAPHYRAGRFFKNWQREGVLQPDPDPAFYVYHQVFEYEGSTYTRRGFICLVNLTTTETATISPTQQTSVLESANRQQLLETARANLAPITGVYSDPDGMAQQILEDAVTSVAPIEARDASGVSHRLWPVSDIHTINDVSSLMATQSICVASGHSEFQAILSSNERSHSEHPKMAMMLCIRTQDDGLITMPSHRLLRGLPEINSDELKQRLSEWFDVRIAGEGSDLAQMVWEQIEIEEDQTTIGLYCRSDERWLVAKLNDAGKVKMSELANEHGAEWQSLGVSIVDCLILGELLGHSERTNDQFAHRTEDVSQAIDNANAESESERIELAILCLPPTLDDLQSLTQQGQLLPSHSTHLHPSTLSGLVFHSHEGQ